MMRTVSGLTCLLYGWCSASVCEKTDAIYSHRREIVQIVESTASNHTNEYCSNPLCEQEACIAEIGIDPPFSVPELISTEGMFTGSLRRTPACFKQYE